MHTRSVGIALSLLTLAVTAQQLDAQSPQQSPKKNELGFVIGGEFIPSNSVAPGFAFGGSREIKTSSSVSLQIVYDRHIHDFKHAALWLDVPAQVGPNHKITGTSPVLPVDNATFFVTPSAKLAFAPHGLFTPWISAGFGYGLYQTSALLQNRQTNPNVYTSTGTAQFGGGVDVKTPFHVFSYPIGLRGEFRDFYSLSQPSYAVPVSGGSQHNLHVGGGATIRF